MDAEESRRCPLIIGAGPAGLTAAHALASNGLKATVFEGSFDIGGLARTATRDDWQVDPGGHRFMTENTQISEIWRSLLPPDEWLTVERSSAMFVDGHFVKYPLEARDLLRQLGGRRAARGIASYALGKVRHAVRPSDDESFRTWGIRTFGEFWYSTFFDSYTRKTWRVDPRHITSDWARQRIQPITWAPPVSLRNQPFLFPKHGPGQVWQSLAAQLTASGVDLRFGNSVTAVRKTGTGWQLELADGSHHEGDAVFSSMPLRSLVGCIDPEPPGHVAVAAKQLTYRDVVTVAVPVAAEHDFPYQWIYVPQDDVKVGRIQNYAQWSRWMVPLHWNGTCLGLEYYLKETERDQYDDEDFLRAAREDLFRLGIPISESEPPFVVRSPYAYPIYDDLRKDAVTLISDWLSKEHPGLYSIGRNGMHQYFNQDHAMLSALTSAQHYLGCDVDPWSSNIAKRH